MTSEQLLSLIRTPAVDPSVAAMLAGFGVTSVPVVKSGDTNVYVDLPSHGLYFIFTDEGFLERKPNARIGEKPPVLSNVTFNSAAIAPYAQYGSPLPLGLQFASSRDAARAALGPPEFSIDRRRMDRWRIDNLWVFAVYSPAFDAIQRLTVQVPDKS